MVLLELFGAAAVLMTAVGVYGVVSYSVTERTREIGLRAALGASRLDIARTVCGGGLALVAAGLVAGLVAALWLARYLRASLYEVSATDPQTLAGVAAVLVVVGVLAHAVPVARAIGVDPAEALRQE